MKVVAIKGGYRFLVDKAIYNIETLHKCFYWYTGEYEVDIETSTEQFYSIELTFKRVDVIDSQLVDKVKRDLVDFRLRDIVSRETQTIRELLVAKAFAHFDLPDDPTTEVSDPVGFNPHLI